MVMDIVSAPRVEQFELALEMMDDWAQSEAVRGFRRELRAQAVLGAADAAACALRLAAGCSADAEMDEMRMLSEGRSGASSAKKRKAYARFAREHALDGSTWLAAQREILAAGVALASALDRPALVVLAAEPDVPLSARQLRGAWGRSGGDEEGWMELFRGDSAELGSFRRAREGGTNVE